jgi:hypothetical protein
MVSWIQWMRLIFCSSVYVDAPATNELLGTNWRKETVPVLRPRFHYTSINASRRENIATWPVLVRVHVLLLQFLMPPRNSPNAVSLYGDFVSYQLSSLVVDSQHFSFVNLNWQPSSGLTLSGREETPTHFLWPWFHSIWYGNSWFITFATEFSSHILSLVLLYLHW